MKTLFTLALLCLSAAVIGQNNTNQWYFGNNAGINFNGASPVAQTGATQAQEASAVWSDNSGNLMFYTDGIKVWDNTHTIMPNGSGLLGGTSSTQTLIVPKPGSCSLFYVFTVGDQTSVGDFRYSIVDMCLNNNKGDVVPGSKNILLHQPCAEKITAVKHANGTDTWVLTHGLGNNQFRAYLLTASGINAPVISSVGSVHPTNGMIGPIVASHSGTKLAIAATFGNIFELADFNPSTGVVSNVVVNSTLSVPWGVYGVEFSPNDNFVYAVKLSGPNKLYQIDVAANTTTLIATSPSFNNYDYGALQLAPNGKIYMVRNGLNYISSIDNPNTPGTGCNFVNNSFTLAPGTSGASGLPNFVPSAVTSTFTPGPVTVALGNDTTLCQASYTLNATVTTCSPAYLWSTGATTPTLSVSASGIYWVQVTTPCGSGTDTITVNFAAPGNTAAVAGNTQICQGQSTTLTASGGASYQWSGGSTATTAVITVSPQATTSYTVNVMNGNCIAGTASVTVNVTPAPQVNVAGVTSICSGQSTTLTASGASNYQWSGGSTATTPSITVSPTSTTSYNVVGDDGVCQSQPVTITVQVTPMPTASISASSQTICTGQTAVLTAAGGSSYQWSGGVTSTSQSVTVSPSVSTAYYLTAVNGSCTSSPDTVVITVLPAPTPSVSGITSICSGHSTTLTASGGSSYQWSGGSSATTSSITVSPLTTTVYYVTVSNGSCSSQPLQTTVQVIPVPVASVTGNTTICTGQSTALTASGGSSYQWNTGDTTQSVTVNPSVTTTYYVTVANGNCYSAPLQVTVSVTPFQGAAITGPSVICANSNAILNASGGGTYVWSTGSTNSSITVNPPVTTTYSVVVSNSSGCTDTAYYTLNVNPPPFVNAGADVTICAGDSIQLNGAFSGSTFYWTPNANISSIWPLNPWVYPTTTTTYVMVGMSQNDCGGRDSVTVTVSPCTGIEETFASQGMILAPNPAGDHFDIYLEQPLQHGVIELYNAQGAVVLRQASDTGAKNRVEVAGLAKGLYLVRITAGKTIKTAQIILE